MARRLPVIEKCLRPLNIRTFLGFEALLVGPTMSTLENWGLWAVVAQMVIPHRHARHDGDR